MPDTIVDPAARTAAAIRDAEAAGRARQEWPNRLAAIVAGSTVESVDHLHVWHGSEKLWKALPWNQIHERAKQIGARIVADCPDGPRPVALLGDPTVDQIAAIIGTWFVGASITIVPGPIRGADPQQWARATAARLTSLGVTTVLGNGESAELLAADPDAPAVHEVTDYGREITVNGPVPIYPSDNPIAVLQSTAGSTGTPKTVVLDAETVVTNIGAVAQRIGTDKNRDSGFSWLPLYHDMGLTVVVTTILPGCAPLWLVPNTAFAAAPFRWLSWLHESGATITAAPNFAYDILGRFGSLVRDIDLSRVRYAISGGEPIDPDAFDTFIEVAARVGLDPAAMAPAYGMAETTCAITLPHPGDGARYDEVTVVDPDGVERLRRYPTLGSPLEGLEVAVLPAGVETPNIVGREVGEIAVRGTSLMVGYLGEEPIDRTEWMRTGDLGYLIDGRLVVCGRAKEIIIVAGRNLFPIEIERAVAAVAGIRSGCVAAIEGGGVTRQGLVIVAERKKKNADESALRRAVTAAVSAEFGIVPVAVIFLDAGSLPKTTSGKLRRLEITRLVHEGAVA
ncbi:AMP-binding protein [Millisia brevis]|uniref:AMP-binding protein n=1 Tax=Millisia brevis TaxID=264148 RepID=UPI00082DA062|nr:AMP-binding protein [Millisia brevis]